MPFRQSRRQMSASPPGQADEEHEQRNQDVHEGVLGGGKGIEQNSGEGNADDNTFERIDSFPGDDLFFPAEYADQQHQNHREDGPKHFCHANSFLLRISRRL